MPIKNLKFAILAAVTLLFSSHSYAQSEQAETNRADAEARKQQMIDDRCADDENCRQRMNDRFAEKRQEMSAGKGERPEGSKKGKKKSKNSREARRQEMLEKRCGDDQACLEKTQSRMDERRDSKRAGRDEEKAEKMAAKRNERCGDDQECHDKMKSRMSEKKEGKHGDRDQAKADKMAEKLNERCGDDEKCREKMAKRRDKMMKDKNVEQDY